MQLGHTLGTRPWRSWTSVAPGCIHGRIRRYLKTYLRHDEIYNEGIPGIAYHMFTQLLNVLNAYFDIMFYSSRAGVWQPGNTNLGSDLLMGS